MTFTQLLRMGWISKPSKSPVGGIAQFPMINLLSFGFSSVQFSFSSSRKLELIVPGLILLKFYWGGTNLFPSVQRTSPTCHHASAARLSRRRLFPYVALASIEEQKILFWRPSTRFACIVYFTPTNRLCAPRYFAFLSGITNWSQRKLPGRAAFRDQARTMRRARSSGEQPLPYYAADSGTADDCTPREREGGRERERDSHPHTQTHKYVTQMH